MARALPLIVLFGPTASGKTALSLALAERFAAEIISCDSLCVYRGMEVGTAKPSAAERARIPHHGLDLYDPDEACTAGDYARRARASLADITARGKLAVVAGGTGLYLPALLDGLFAAPAADQSLLSLLRRRVETRGASHLHRTLARFDPAAARAIHPHDVSKAVRAIEVSLAARRPMTEQWTEGRDALTGYRVLRLGLDPPRPLLHARINQRAASMFANGLVEETRGLLMRFGPHCRPFSALGYKQAAAVLAGNMTQAQAVVAAQAGHRQYAKRQMTWFRREAEAHETTWLQRPGEEVVHEAGELVRVFLEG